MQTDDKLSGLPNAGNGAQGTEGTKNVTRVTDDKLALNEHERMTQIHTVRNVHIKREKKHAEFDKIGTKKKDTKKKRNRLNICN